MFHLSDIFRPGPIAPVSHRVAEAFSHPPQALVIDNDHAARAVVVRALTRIGIRPEVFETGESALARMNDGMAPALITLDLRLPCMSGAALCREVRSLPQGRDVPLLVFATGHDLLEMTLVLEVGADAFLEKPLHTRDLTHLVTELLAQPRLAERRSVPLGLFVS